MKPRIYRKNFSFYKKLTSVLLSFLFLYTQTVSAQNFTNSSDFPVSGTVTADNVYNLSSTDSPTPPSNYSGSQASDKQTLLKEDVNEKTGDVNLNYNLVNMNIPGLNVNFNLSMNYATAKSQFPATSALPSGWDFDLPFLDLTNFSKAIVHFNGVSYTEDPLWSDSENYQSGLRYANNHGIKFKRYLTSQELKLDPQTSVFYNFSLKFVDGSKVYFDIYGRPIVKAGKFNLYFLYSYYDQESFFKSKLKEIRNNLYENQRVTFNYSPNAITITAPNNSKTSILISDNKVMGIENAIGEKVSFQYKNTSNPNFVTYISYPNGLNTVLKYEKSIPIGNCGTQSQKPVISEVLHVDSSQNNKILNDTLYNFSTSSNANYSGYPNIFSCPKSEQDMLMESNNFSFKYDVLITKVGNVNKISDDGKSISTSKLVTSTKTTYNFLHLPIIVETYSSDLPANIAYFTTYLKYNLTQDVHKMGPAFNYPIAKETFVYDKNMGEIRPNSYSETLNDAYGNQISTTDFAYNDLEKKWTPILKKTTEYFTDSDNDYSLPKRESTFDYISNINYETNYTRTVDKREIATKTVGILNSQGTFVPSLSYTHNYDEFGRALSEKTECFSSINDLCKGNVKQFFTTTVYNYNPSQNTLQILTTDAASHQWTKTIDVAIGKEISIMSPSGKTMFLNSYDSLGRITKETIPGLNSSDLSTKNYIYKSVQKNGVNEFTEINDNNYSLTKVYDALGREIKKYDNFYPDLDSAGKSISSENMRVLSSTEYNSFGLIDYETNQYGQKTLTSYDNLGRNNGTVDFSQNTKLIKIDDANRTETTYLNGFKISSVVKDYQDNPVLSTTFPNEGYKCNSFLTNFCSNISSNQYAIKVQKSDFDALKHEIKRTELFYNPDGSLLNQNTTEMSYNLLNKVYLTKFTGYDGISTELLQNYDIFGNVVSFTKQRSENGKILPLFTSDTYSYNSLSKLEKIIRQDGKEEQYSYNDDSILIQKKSYSGVVHTYNYFYNNVLKSEQVSNQSISVSLKNIENLTFNIKEKLNVYFNIFFNSKENSNSIRSIAPNAAISNWTTTFNVAKNYNTILYNYNKQNSLTDISYSTNADTADQTTKITYTYLADGTINNSTIYANGNTQLTSYDRFGRVLSTRDIASGNITNYTYDYQNNHPERVHSVESLKNKQLIIYDYYRDNEANENGLLGSLKTTLNFVNEKLISSKYVVSDPLFRELTTVNIDSAGNIIQNKTNVFNSYNHLSQVIYNSSINSNNAENYTLNYTYDSNNILLGFQKINSNGNTDYEEKYGVDSNYNVLERNIYIAGTLVNHMQYTYNNLNQLTSYTNSQSTKPFELSYDADGRMIVDDLGNMYAYENFSDKITEIKNNANVVIAQYSYYPTSKRMAKMVFASTDNVPTEFYYNAEGSVTTEAQKNSAGQSSFASYLFENKDVKSSRTLSTSNENDIAQSLFYVNNAKNTDKTFTINSSSVENLQTYYYTPYGEILNSQGQSVTTKPYSIKDNPYSYENSRMTDSESGLILLDARYYNPRLMRFMTLDSYNVDNKYSYANGDPIGNADPSGHMSKTAGVIMNVLGIILSAAIIAVSIITLQAEVTAAAGSSFPAMLGAIGGGFGVASGALGIASLYTEKRTSFALGLASTGAAFISILFNIGSSVAWYKLTKAPDTFDLIEAAIIRASKNRVVEPHYGYESFIDPVAINHPLRSRTETVSSLLGDWSPHTDRVINLLRKNNPNLPVGRDFYGLEQQFTIPNYRGNSLLNIEGMKYQFKLDVGFWGMKYGSMTLNSLDAPIKPAP